MRNHQDFDWVFDHDYCGRILQGDYSDPLKKRVAYAIRLFRNLNAAANPAMPYISAWRENEDHFIWYEFVGNRLLDLLQCPPCEVADLFRDSVLEQCSFHYQSDQGKITQKTLKRDELPRIRGDQRRQVRSSGTVEATYHILLRDKSAVWLKDQAAVEFFPDDSICLCLGALIDVTKEMEADQQRRREEDDLRRRHAELLQKLEKQSKELWKIQLDMIYRLARASHLRDQSFGPHITKMSHYSDILAEAAGLDGKQREMLFHATAMHDVGKIGIADAILRKPCKLTPQEFEVIKTHSIIGAKLLSGNDSPLLNMAKAIALTHHERWDGAGYPKGLCREEIPISGRIAAICDVFDALTSERPYKKPWDAGNAFSEIEKEQGKKFDPHLVELFLRRKKEIISINRRFSRSTPNKNI